MSTKLNFTIKKSLKNKFNEKVESDGMFSNSSECLRFLIHDYIKNDSHKIFNKNNIFEIKEVNFWEIGNYLEREFVDFLNGTNLNVGIKMKKYQLDELKFLINNSFEDQGSEFQELLLQNLIDVYKESNNNNGFKIPVFQFIDQKQIKKKVPFEESNNLSAISRDEYIIDPMILNSIFEGHKQLLPNNNLIIEDKRKDESINILFSLKNIVCNMLNVNKEIYSYFDNYSEIELTKGNKQYEPIDRAGYTLYILNDSLNKNKKYINIKVSTGNDNLVVTLINYNSESTLKSILKGIDQLSNYKELKE